MSDEQVLRIPPCHYELQIFATLTAEGVDTVEVSLDNKIPNTEMVDLDPDDLTGLRLTGKVPSHGTISILVLARTAEACEVNVSDCLLALSSPSEGDCSGKGKLCVEQVPVTAIARAFKLTVRPPRGEIWDLDFDVGLDGVPATNKIEVTFDDILIPTPPPPPSPPGESVGVTTESASLSGCSGCFEAPHR
ncbi:MAG: hypothetical protein AAGF11_26825 [Myxococcota bacterium]